MMIARSRQGCDECRRRRRKCDENKPICGQCRSFNRACSYTLRVVWARLGPATSRNGRKGRSAAQGQRHMTGTSNPRRRLSNDVTGLTRPRRRGRSYLGAAKQGSVITAPSPTPAQRHTPLSHIPATSGLLCGRHPCLLVRPPVHSPRPPPGPRPCQPRVASPDVRLSRVIGRRFFEPRCPRAGWR
ncbi:hypothetical protein VTK26DRAFT_8014 [Humicola hyalothermophila]